MRDFDTVMKDMTSTSVHTPTAIGNEKKPKAKPFKAIIGEQNIEVSKRELYPNGDTNTAKSPFKYDPNVLGSLRPDQVPRFFGALTNGDKLPKKEVKLSDLHAMQDRVDPKKVEAIRNNGAGGKLAIVVQHNGAQYIADGHHRLTADWLNGKDTILVRHKDLEPVDHALKREPVHKLIVKAEKVDDSMGVVFGWAIVSKINGQDYYDMNIDHDGPHAGQRVPEHVPEDAVEKSALQFVESGAVGNEMHEGPDVGNYPFVFPMTTSIYKSIFGTEAIPPKTGLLVGYRPPENVLAKFRTGEYTGFSIEGRRISYEEHSA